jgi:hypothetical protein
VPDMHQEDAQNLGADGPVPFLWPHGDDIIFSTVSIRYMPGTGYRSSLWRAGGLPHTVTLVLFL